VITIKTKSELDIMREGGRILATTMREVSSAIRPGRTTPRELDDLALKTIRAHGAEPSFLGYRGFPAAACISVNEVVVHGIPDDRTLQEGDIIGLDFGVFYKGFHTDSAWTFPVGREGNRVGDISQKIQKYVEGAGYSIVTDLVGHGIGKKLHEEPSVPNFGRAGRGERLRNGMTICIEPMVNAGRPEVVTLPDDWTLVTKDGTLSAHFEHTVAITPDGPVLLTADEANPL